MWCLVTLHMQPLHNGQPLLAEAERFNDLMSPVWTCVEQVYEKVVRNWVFVDFWKQMKIQGSRIEAMWHGAILYFSQMPNICVGPHLHCDNFLDTVMHAYENVMN